MGSPSDGSRIGKNCFLGRSINLRIDALPPKICVHPPRWSTCMTMCWQRNTRCYQQRCSSSKFISNTHSSLQRCMTRNILCTSMCRSSHRKQYCRWLPSSAALGFPYCNAALHTPCERHRIFHASLPCGRCCCHETLTMRDKQTVGFSLRGVFRSQQPIKTLLA